MNPRIRRNLRARLGAAAVIAVALLPVATGLGATPASAGASHALIEGSGSSWAANAVNQWIADVQSEGIEVDYTPSGDAQGRQDFANRTSDFAVTSLGYQGVDKVTGVSDTSQGRRFAYLPIAAGGTAFPYQIRYDGKMVRNLRLSGETLTKIFTDQITNWDNPEITKDNNGHALPSIPIIPVVQSEGSGATAQLTKYFANQYPSLWQAFSHSSTFTEYYPQDPGSNQIAQNGSDGAMNYVSSKVANGSIGYVEYSYALAKNYPVAKLLNKAGYYTLPTQYNVAVALEDAVINMNRNSPNYLLQNLDHVYTDPDPRTYALSSYVYEIEPTGTNAQDSKITTAKRQSIADFTYYSICQGQKEIGPIGYSPLPVNLVEAGFGQIDKLKKADPAVDLTERNVRTCDNPTFVEGHPSKNYLAKIAPLPPSCDKIGAGPCAAGVTPNGIGKTPTTSGTYPGTKSSGNGGGDSQPGSGGGKGGGSSSGAKGGSTTGGTQPTTGTTNPLVADQNGEGADQAVTVPAGLAGYRSSHLTAVLAPLAVALLVLALVLPPLVAHRIQAGRRGRD
ncbi:MAG TPA: substrate-binding domain-containing protein [Mycobacteriales bacterium]|nr:substrate-binding domain-containing protein [Mycobacteriales bacterium]